MGPGSAISVPTWHPLAPARVVDAAVAAIGPVRILVSNHAKSGGDGSLLDMTPDSLDIHWQVNTRSTLLLTRHFAEQFSGAAAGERTTAPGVRPASLRPLDEFATGRVIWMISGQHDGPMPKRPGTTDLLARHRRGALDRRPGADDGRRVSVVGKAARRRAGI